MFWSTTPASHHLPSLTAFRYSDAARPSAELTVAEQAVESLVLPSGAAKVLGAERYRTLECAARFLRRTDELLEDAAASPTDAGAGAGAALHVAQVGSRLVQLLPPTPRRRLLLLRALALLGSAQQAAGQRAEARSSLGSALEIASRFDADPCILGDLLRRHALLEAEFGRWRESLSAADDAVRLIEAESPACPQMDWNRTLGRALLSRAELRFRRHQVAEALDDAGLALESLDPVRHPRPVGHCLELFSRLVASEGRLDVLHGVARRLGTLRDRLDARIDPPRAVRSTAARLHALEARLFSRMGATDRAERCLRQARRIYRELGLDRDLLATSLELGRIFARDERREELRRLSRDTLDRLPDPGSSKAEAARLSVAIRRWQRALGDDRLDAEILGQITAAVDELPSAA